MKKILVIVMLIMALAACVKEAKTAVDIEEAITPYLAEGVELSDEAPAEGYHSPKQAVIETTKELCETGDLDLEYKGEDRTWLLDCKVEEPVLVYNIDEQDVDHALDSYYYIYATHPEYGTVGSVVYKYNENSHINYGVAEITPPHKNNEDSMFVGVTKKSAVTAMEEYLGCVVEGDPVAVSLSYDYPRSWSDYDWYFEIPNGRSGGYEEYLVRSTAYASTVKGSRGFAGGAEIYKITNQLNLLDHIAETKQAIASRSFGSLRTIPTLYEGKDYERVQ